MASWLVRLRPVISPPQAKHTASLIVLHGGNDTGHVMRTHFKRLLGDDLAFPHIRVIYPTTPVRFKVEKLKKKFDVRPHKAGDAAKDDQGTPWFDRRIIALNQPEDTESIDKMSEIIGALLDLEIKNGIPLDRMILGGFSNGGAMAMYHGFQHANNLAGIFCLSSFLPANSVVFKAAVKNKGKTPPLLQCHGEEDDLVKEEWGWATQTKLTKLGVQTDYHSYPDLGHDLNAEEIHTLRDWILEKLPENPS